MDRIGDGLLVSFVCQEFSGVVEMLADMTQDCCHLVQFLDVAAKGSSLVLLA